LQKIEDHSIAVPLCDQVDDSEHESPSVRKYTVAGLPCDPSISVLSNEPLSRLDEGSRVSGSASRGDKIQQRAADLQTEFVSWAPDLATCEADFHQGPVGFVLANGYPSLLFTATLFNDLIDALESRNGLSENRAATEKQRQHNAATKYELFTKS
jgi:hypothetical protein